MLKYLRMGNRRVKTIWWSLIIVTVVTFLGGFVFIIGSGIGAWGGGSVTGEIGRVGGASITREDYHLALAEQRELFKRQAGRDAGATEAKFIETQAWRGLVSLLLLRAAADRAGLRATDREVVFTLRTAPPPLLAAAPDFQTDGQFDVGKYMAALSNPNNNWAAFEDLVRRQLPARKLQERLLASLKMSEPELRQAFRRRFEQVALTVAHLPGAAGETAAPSEADLERVYRRYRGRLARTASTRLEVLALPKQYSTDDLRQARELAQSLADRARRGEDFAALARDYSEGPEAAAGGEVGRAFAADDFGPVSHSIAELPVGGILDPIEDQGRFIVIKLVERISTPGDDEPGLRVAQIVIPARESEDQLREQYEAARKIRDRAARVGLGRAAAEHGRATFHTELYDVFNAPRELVGTPEAGEWGLGAKPGTVSEVYVGRDQLLIVQIAEQHPPGPPRREDIGEPLRQMAEFEARAAAAQPGVDRIAAALAAGEPLEQAARAANATVFTVPAMTREQPDPRLAMTPEVVGAAFATEAGRTVGPIATLNGWYFVRVDRQVPADDGAYDELKGQVATDVLGRRQQQVLNGWLAELRSRARVRDLRAVPQAQATGFDALLP